MNELTIPSKENREKLAELSETFKPTDVKFLLAVNSNFSIEECVDDAQAMISRLQSFVKNEQPGKAGGFQYTDVTGF